VLSGVSVELHGLSQFEQDHGESCLDILQHFLLKVWRKRVCKSLLRFLTMDSDGIEAGRDREVGRDALQKVAQATWWDWTGGSTPFFWRWPPYAWRLVRDGHPPWFISDPPRYVKPQRPEKDQMMHSKMKQKLEAVVSKGCIAEGEVKSLTSYFAVPKGPEDI
jgi:hypothetical protein